MNEELAVLRKIVDTQGLIRRRVRDRYPNRDDWDRHAKLVREHGAGSGFPEWESVTNPVIIAFDTGFWFGWQTALLATEGLSTNEMVEALWQRYLGHEPETDG